MTRPGDRLRALAARLFDAETMERVVDPAIADLQVECAAAIHHGRLWRRGRVRLAGYIALLKVMFVCGCRPSNEELRHWSAHDRRPLTRALGFSLVAVSAATVLLELPPVLQIANSPRSLSTWRLAAYLAPQALALAVPIGYMVGVAIGLRGGTISRRVRVAILGVAIVFSIVSCGNLGWLVPAANQAFRVYVWQDIGQLPPPRGENELSINELGRLVEDGHGRGFPLGSYEWHHVNRLRFDYHSRWAISFASLALAIVALSVVARRSVRPWTAGAMVCGAVVGYYVLVYFGRLFALDGGLPALIAAWLPNVVLVLIAVLCAVSARPGPERPAPAAS
jgi:hypothetical protein